MACNKKSKYLSDRQFADLIKNGPLVSIDLIIRDQKDRVLLQYRPERPAKGYWFVPGGRIRKYEGFEEAITRIANDEIQRTFADIKIDPKKCRLLNVYKHHYEKDNKYSDNTSFPDMRNEDTHYVSIAKDYKINQVGEDLCGDDDNPKWKWWTINELICSGSVHKYTKDFFLTNYHIPNDSGIYRALMSHYIHYDRLFWSRTRIILAVQGAILIGGYKFRFGPMGPTIMFVGFLLILAIWGLIFRDIKNSRVNEDIMDNLGKKIFNYSGTSLPIRLRSDPLHQLLSGRKLIHYVVTFIMIINLGLGCLYLRNIDPFPPSTIHSIEKLQTGMKEMADKQKELEDEVIEMSKSLQKITDPHTLKETAIKARTHNL
jgi:colanic acid biosynthesis protein WcaH